MRGRKDGDGDSLQAAASGIWKWKVFSGRWETRSFPGAR